MAFVLNIGYGIKISRDNEHYRDMLQYTSELIEEVAVPGKYLVDLLPALEYLPEWFPGAAFKQDAKTVRETFLAARRTLYEEGKSLLVRVLHDRRYPLTWLCPPSSRTLRRPPPIVCLP